MTDTAESQATEEQHPERTFGWADMFVHPDEDPRSDGGYEGERATLLGYLRDYRLTLEMKCAGLDAEALARRSVPPSNMSLLGLVRHLARVEHYWFHNAMGGEDVPRLYRTEDGVDVDFDGAVADPEVVAEAWETWRTEVAFAEKFMDATSDLATNGSHHGTPIALRDVLVHMIEEYARHMGHADFLRERIDGRVGQ